MKGKITLQILETISCGVSTTRDLIAAILSAGYGASFSGIQYKINKRQSAEEKKKADRKERREIKQKYYKLLYKLKKDGLLEEKSRSGKNFLAITKKGKNKITTLRDKSDLALPETTYKKGSAHNLIIVIFDIPEKERRKRSWLRSVLNNMGLKMIQKSVWIGKTSIPQKFLEDLSILRLIDFVEIFEITKTGNLKHLI